jgi:hypothetical protein
LLLCVFLGERSESLLHLLQFFLAAFYSGLELLFVDESFGVAVDQTREPLFQFGGLRFQHRTVLLPLRLLPAALMLLCYAGRVLQQGTDLLPHRLFQQIGTHLPVGAHPLTAKAIGIAPDAAIIGIVAGMSFPGARADGFAVISITALLAADQALQQIACAALALTSMLAIFRQLLSNGSKE